MAAGPIPTTLRLPTTLRDTRLGLSMSERNIARHDHRIFAGDNPIGKITSGTFSPTLAKPIALGYVPTEFTNLDQNLLVEIRGNLKSATVVKKPFYKRR